MSTSRPSSGPLRRLPSLGAMALAFAPLLSMAAEPEPSIQEQMKRVLERMQQLEQRNQDLERRLEQLTTQQRQPAGTATSAAAEAAWGTRLQAVEQQQKSLSQQVQGLARPPDSLDAGTDDGPKIEGSVVTVLQRINRGGSADDRSTSRLNYRGDVTVELPAGFIGEARGTAVGQLRFGQGGGVGLRPTYTSTPNSTTFEAAAGSDETYAVVAQAYYQLDVPLDNGRFNDQKGTRLEFNAGKMDLFGQFDQNAVAGDEAAQFLNNAFVHNPLLDSGGDIGADNYGFAPGLRVGYFNEGESLGWGVSFAAFAAGEGARYNGSLGRPLFITQFEVSPRQINGEPRGTYRVYAWTNGRTADFDGNEQRHSGFGISVDQKIGREWNVFGRYGQRTSGSGPFDRALTLGFEHGGRLWGRSRDAVGVAYGLLDTSSDWRSLTADGVLTGYAASGRERILELYYRYKVNDKLEITPDFQLIQRAGGDGTAPNAAVVGVRGTLGF